jgi:hypothetical protein
MSHRGLEDKNRRAFNFRDPQVENVLPEHFVEQYPKLISLLKAYYKFDDAHETTDLFNHLFTTRDITQTDERLLQFIEDELLLGQSYFQGFPDKRAAANFSSVLFKSKGSKYSIQWFFRSFYGIDPEIEYPKEKIFKVGQSAIGPDSLSYITDNELYQTFSILLKVGLSIAQWEEIYKLFVHPAGMYLGAKVLIVSEDSFELENLPAPGDEYEFGSPAAPVASVVTRVYGEHFAIEQAEVL